MLLAHKEYLTDPLTNKPLDIAIFAQEWNHIMQGELFSDDNYYPIIDGVPRLLVGELKKDLLQKKHDFLFTYREQLSDAFQDEWQKAVNDIQDLDSFMAHQKRTSESFSFERNNIYKENSFEESNFLHFWWWYAGKEDIAGKIVLDIGCGSWRFTKVIAALGAKVSIWVDLSEAVDFAFWLTKHLDSIFIVQGDIYNLPFNHNIEIATSIGVLHHLPNPAGWFSAIAKKVLAPEGRIIIWVYARKNNARALYFYEPIRTITRHIPKRLLLWLCHIPAIIVHGINYLTQFIWRLWFKNAIKHIPFYYYINFPYNMKHNDAFDVLATPKSNYYYTEDIAKRYNDAGLHGIQGKYLQEAGLTFIWKYL